MKKWYQSKTLYFSGVVVSSGLITLLIDLLGSDEVREFINSLPLQYQGLTLAAIGLIAAILRLVTREGVEL